MIRPPLSRSAQRASTAFREEAPVSAPRWASRSLRSRTGWNLNSESRRCAHPFKPELPSDLVFKKPFRLTETSEFMIGLGPFVSRTFNSAQSGTYSKKRRFSTAGMLSGNHSKPRGHLAAVVKAPYIGDGGHQGAGGQRPDVRDRSGQGASSTWVNLRSLSHRCDHHLCEGDGKVLHWC